MTSAASAAPDEGPRALLDRLIRERGEDYAGLSRLVGRNAAYIQQYIKRGSPRRLGERERGILAAYFRVDEHLLGGPATRAPMAPVTTMRAVPSLDVGAAAGAGGLAEDEAVASIIAFDERWLRQLTRQPDRLSIIRVEGDSMVPTLGHGDDIMVDAADAADRLRDGIYVLRRDGLLLVKRLATSAVRGRVTIISDNPVYPREADVSVAAITIVGRVVWAGRRL